MAPTSSRVGRPSGGSSTETRSSFNWNQPSVTISIAPAGGVTSVQRVPESSQPAHPRYDACVRGAFSSAVFPATPQGATITLGIVALLPR